MKKHITIIFSVLFCATIVHAQKDTSTPATVTIISAYKPVLRDVAKINFSASPLQADTSKSIKPYKIPAQQLMYGYQPIVLKPLAMDMDSMPQTGLRNYIKAGFGNYTTPYLKAGIGFGDGTRTLFNVYGDYTSSKGKIENQDYSNISIRATGSYFSGNHEVYSKADFKHSQYYLYGYDHALYVIPKQSISHQFNDINFAVGLRNSSLKQSGWDYNPSIALNYFGFKDSLSEAGGVVNLPLSKTITDAFSLKINACADITRYSTRNKDLSDTGFNNNIYSVMPSFSYHSDKFKMDGGLGVYSDNGRLVFLPNVFGEFSLSKKNLIVQGGWVGKINKNTYANLSNINPYLNVLSSQKNTVETELYGGIKSALGKHLQFSAKAGVVSYRYFQLFINDPATNGKSFKLSQEDNMNNFKIHADVSYVLRDELSFTGGITFNGYTGMQQNKRAWNTTPMETNASLRWTPIKRLSVKSDLYIFAGGHYLGQNNEDLSFDGAADLSVGAEYRINDKFGAFIDLNNIFGKPYERWHNYRVYGISAIGGITIRF